MSVLSRGQLESLISLGKFLIIIIIIIKTLFINWIQNNNMPRGFSGNLIFAIIAQMLSS